MNKTNFTILSFAILSILIVFSSQLVFAAQSAVNLGSAGNFVILTKTGITTTGTTAITGNIGASPIDSTAITGFGLIADSSNQFSTSSLVTGKIYAADYTSPTPADMTSAISDMETAYTDAAGRTLPDYTELGAGDISGMTLSSGLYKWGTGVHIDNRGVTLNGGANDIWIFQIAQDLTVDSAAIVTLSGGAQAKNIFWQVGGGTGVFLGTTSIFNGNILATKGIVFNTGAVLNGRALAQSAVTLDANSITLPSSAVIIPTVNPPAAGGSSGSSSSGSGSSGGSSSSSSSSKVNSITNKPNVSIETTPKKEETKETNQETDKIISIVSGVSVTKTKNGESVKISSENGRVNLNSGNVKVNTALSVEVEKDSIWVTRSNGAKSEIKIMPSAASQTAIAKLGLKVCSEQNNCTIILKEVGNGNETKLAYQLKAKKDVKFLGLFKVKMNVETNVDAQTGLVISSKKPWWSFMTRGYSK